MKKQLSTLVVVSAILLTACGAGLSAQSTATLAPPTATLPPTLTSTPEPTFTPTATLTPRLPVSVGTQMPALGLALSGDNLDQVVELARWGKGVITDAAYSSDGKLIAVATTLGVSIYEADTLTEILYMETDSPINSLAFSPNGESLAVGLADNTIKLWKTSDGALLRTLGGPPKEVIYIASFLTFRSGVTSVSFSPDGSLLASRASDNAVNLWQISDGSLERTLKASSGGVTTVFFSPDGLALFLGSSNGKVEMIQVSDGKQLHTFSAEDAIIDATISADGKILAAYANQFPITGNLILWNVEDGEKLTTIKALEGYTGDDITSIALSPDGQYIAAGWKGYSAKIWSVASGSLQSTLEDLQPKGEMYYYSSFALAFSPDGQTMLLAGANIIGVWDVAKSVLLNRASIKSDSIYKIAVSPDGQTLASIEGTNVYLWQLSDGKPIPFREKPQGRDFAFSPDGTSLLTNLFDNTARIWPLSEQGARRSFEMEKKENIWEVAFSPDGKNLALGTIGKVEIRQVADGLLLRTIRLPTSNYGPAEIAFSPNGEFLAVSINGIITLFTASDGKTLKSFKGGVDIAFSPDSTLLAGGAQVWKIPGGETLLTLKDHPEYGVTVAFSPDGMLLVSGSGDETIKVWSVSDGTLLKTWKGHSGWVTDLIFSSDGKLLISSSADGTIRIWGLKP